MLRNKDELFLKPKIQTIKLKSNIPGLIFAVVVIILVAGNFFLLEFNILNFDVGEVKHSYAKTRDK